MGLRALGLVALVAAVLPTPLGAQQRALPPFSFADVDFQPNCVPNAAFVRALALLLPATPADAGGGAPEVDLPLYDAASGAVVHTLQLGRAFDWHGLRLVEVRFYHGIESGPSNHSLVFADTPGRVAEVWNARGWNLPPAGQTRVIEDEGVRVAVGIESQGDLAAVTCFSD